MAKGTSIKQALQLWEKENEKSSIDATDIQLQFQWPPIEKMDNTLSTLVNCCKLSLSTNMIDKINGLAGMKMLTILSLSRNAIKSLSGIEVLANTLEELWISYNLIEKLRGIEMMKKLRVLYIGNNMIKDWNEFDKLIAVQTLNDLLFVGNPLVDNVGQELYRKDVIRKLKMLKILDGEPIVRDDDDDVNDGD